MSVREGPVLCYIYYIYIHARVYIHAHTQARSIGWRQKAFIARSTCLCWSFPRLETFSAQQQSSRLAELLPNDVPDRYFVSLINKAATLRDLFALPSAFHRLCIAVYPRARMHRSPLCFIYPFNREKFRRSNLANRGIDGSKKRKKRKSEGREEFVRIRYRGERKMPLNDREELAKRAHAPEQKYRLPINSAYS